MIIRVVWAVISGAKPCRFTIRDLAQLSRYRSSDLLSLTCDSSDLEALVLRSEENFVSVKAKEDLCRILSG